MKKALFIIIPLALIVAGIVAYLVFSKGGIGSITDKLTELVTGKPVSGDTAWQYTPTFSEPVTGTSTATEDITLGDLASQDVSITVTKGAFDADTTVSISNPTEVPEYYGSVIEPLGAPIELTANGEGARLNEKATITFAFDPTALGEEPDTSFLRVVYFNGDVWDYIKPTAVDIAAGTMTFDTYHFSFFGGTKIKDETELIKQWSHSQALDDALRDELNDIGDHVAEQIVDQLLEKMGLEDESTKAKILKDMLTDDSYKELIDTVGEGNIPDISQKIALVAGASIAKIVPESAWQGALGEIAGDTAEDVAKVAEAAGYAAEGRYKDAAKIIGEQIADKFLITTAGKVAVEVVNHQIESWKNSEVEAAYQAYKNGADAKFYGYNNDPGEFDTVWSQMRGVRRQLEIEAIRAENEARADSGMPPLTSAQEENVRNDVETAYRNQFAERVKQDEAIAKEEKKLQDLMGAFKAAKFFDTTYGPGGFDGKGYTFEDKLGLLGHFADKMMKDTNRPDFLTKEGIRPDGKLLIGDFVRGAQLWFTVPNGKQLYADYLKTEFGIILYPELVKLTGSYSGAMTITDVQMPQEMIDAIEKAKTEAAAGGSSDVGISDSGEITGLEGCDMTFDLRELIGKSFPIGLTLSPTSESGGDMIFTSEDGEPQSMPFTYTTGTIQATVSEEGAVGNMSLMASERDADYSLDGDFVITMGESAQQIKITAYITAQKGK